MNFTGQSTELVELVDRQFGYLLAAADAERRLLLVPRLLRFLQFPPLSALIDDLEREADLALRELNAADVALRDEVATLWRAHRAALFERADECRRIDEFTQSIFEGLEARIAARAPIEYRDDGATPAWDTTTIVRDFQHVVKTATQDAEAAGAAFPDSVLQLSSRLHWIHRRNDFYSRGCTIQAETLAGVALKRLRAAASAINPEPPSDGVAPSPRDAVAEMLRYQRDMEIARELHDAHKSRAPRTTQDDVASLAARVARDAALLHDELRLRIAVGCSRDALVRRCAARCESFDAERLREIADGEPARAERRLTLHFAGLLFDHGVTPLVDAAALGGRADALSALDGGPSFYLEARHYRSRSPRAQLRGAYRQAWRTWGRLRAEFDVPEAFLIVFRRAGPIVELPEVIRYGDLRLRSVLVDLAESVGSHEAIDPVVFSEEELAPREDDAIESPPA